MFLKIHLVLAIFQIVVITQINGKVKISPSSGGVVVNKGELFID